MLLWWLAIGSSSCVFVSGLTSMILWFPKAIKLCFVDWFVLSLKVFGPCRGSNQPKLIFGSLPLRIQSSHLIFTFSNGCHSSVFTCGKLEKSAVFIPSLATLFILIHNTIIFSLSKNRVRAPCTLITHNLTQRTRPVAVHFK